MPTPKSFLLAAALALPALGHAQFMDSFDRDTIEGWFTMTGDGSATIAFTPMDGHARIHADGTQDRFNVWWVLIKRDISASIDLRKLADPQYELRVEARVRTNKAPHRVNFMLNTNRTTDFHEHLREYDLPDHEWHTISMTTKNFQVAEGDSVFVQLGVTDFGQGVFDVDVDYYRADVVRRDQAGPDLGEPLVYHPPVADVARFGQHLGVAQDSVVQTDYPEVNFNDWHAEGPNGPERVLSVADRQWTILRWDFSPWRGRKADGAGVLELTTASLALGGDYVTAFGEDLGVEFGKVRVFEILGGDPAWDQKTVTLTSLLQGKDPADVFNTQMTIDLEVAEKRGGKTYFTLPRPVMQRLLDGTTKGLLVRPLGVIAASFYASENAGGLGPKLHFNLQP